MMIEDHLPSRPAHFVLRTADAAGAATFYGELFGWQVGSDDIFLSAGRQVARIEVGAGGWLPYLTVPDLDAALGRASAAGATSIGTAVTGAAGRSAVVVEPGGTELGLWQAGSGPGVGVMGEPGAVVWVEEKTHHQATETAFLAELFGFEVLGPEGPGSVRVLRGEGPLCTGVMQFDGRWAPDEAPHWLLYFEVEDVEKSPVSAVENGGSVWFPPFDTPLGRMAYLRDPAGNAFAVVTVSAQGRSMTGGDPA